MTLLDKVNGYDLEVSRVIRDLEKCKQISRTKKEVVMIAENSVSTLSELEPKLSGYRNTFDTIVVGEDRNTLYDDIQGIGDVIATAIYDICNDQSEKAANDLAVLNKYIRG